MGTTGQLEQAMMIKPSMAVYGTTMLMQLTIRKSM